MNIGVDVRHLLTPTPSGVGLSTRALLDAMLRVSDPEDVQFTLFANAAGTSEDLPASWTEHPHVQVVNPGVPNRVLNAGVFALRRPYIDQLMGGVDVVWSPNVLFLSVSLHARLVLTVHDLSFLLLPETYSYRRQLWHKAVRAVDLMKRADALLAVSETTRRDLIDTLQLPSDRIHVVPHGVPQLSSTQARPSSWDWEDDAPFVLSVSTIEPRKNLPALLAAYERLVSKDAIPHKLVIAGGWGWKSSELKSALATSSVRDRVLITDYVSEEEKSWLLDRAEVVVFPSLYEGFGLPPLEAFQAGTPVLASSTAAVAETVGDAGLLVNPYDVGELTFGLRELLRDAELRETFVGRGRERLQQFSWEDSAQRALTACASVMSVTESV